MMSTLKATPGPWFVNDLRASKMRELGWKGPSVDKILIMDKSPSDVARSGDGDNCIIARIAFENRTEELNDGNLADAHLLAAAPDLYQTLSNIVTLFESNIKRDAPAQLEAAREALSRARGETSK
jgi:hypothetical protein